ncbi:quorum sensing histidine kinase QseC [Entomohabitans teleogrylli]|uniref:quorum sensing histidine kinase QseC n=1 Tax=Entomohabitans teleogrylli TaxID=1384589 RepID=UPI00073D86EA|nr:quorum sensing histidine kinase QseC [Entomohabitans teleogrylli]
MKLPRLMNLKTRLALGMILLATLAWIGASLAAWQETRQKLDKLFDTQQMLFAKRLSVMPLENSALRPLEKSKQMIRNNRGAQDDDTLAFAIFSADGAMLLHDGDNGPAIPWRYQGDGFTNGYLNGDDDEWRFFWLTSADGKYRIAVGQEQDYRHEMALDIVTGQMAPWLTALVLMVVLMIWLLIREMSPIASLARELRQRQADNTTALKTADVPGEVRPLVEALNQLFARTRAWMARERQFTSDAAHELRSPLTALKVQAEVAQLAHDDAQGRRQALDNLHQGVDRASRLVDQLLTLSRLDSLESLDGVETCALDALIQQAIMDIYPQATQADIDIRYRLIASPAPRLIQPLLFSLLARNLLDNALRYTPAGSLVDVVVEVNGFTVSDNGPGVSGEALERLGERFYRPPGQKKTGSGLGLSIVQRIAALHQMRVTFSNRPEGGFSVRISW